jgi:hypothetical protein
LFSRDLLGLNDARSIDYACRPHGKSLLKDSKALAIMGKKKTMV